MLAKIEQLLQEIEGLQAANAEELEALRIKYLSKKGAINELLADFRNVPAEQKKDCLLYTSGISIPVCMPCPPTVRPVPPPVP